MRRGPEPCRIPWHEVAVSDQLNSGVVRLGLAVLSPYLTDRGCSEPRAMQRAEPDARPRIGLTLDAEPPGGYSRLPWYAIRENYCAAIARAGGLPIALPHETDLAAAYLDLLDGLVVTGGAFDLDPSLYGARERHATVRTKEQRTAFEWAITQAALDARPARPRHLRRPAAAQRGPGGRSDPAHPGRGAGLPGPRAAESAHRARARGRRGRRDDAARKSAAALASRSTAPITRRPARSAPTWWSAGARRMA